MMSSRLRPGRNSFQPPRERRESSNGSGRSSPSGGPEEAGDPSPSPGPEPGGGLGSGEPTAHQHPSQSPLYHAKHVNRYQRQDLIRAYEARIGVRLIVVIDIIDSDIVTNLEEHLFGIDPGCDLHLLLRSPGGNAEQAIRAVRSLQSRCSRLSVVIPDMAKSAATLLALGADEIRLGPTSDLGPVDPQMFLAGRWIQAKNILRAVEQAEIAVRADGALAGLWAALLAEVSAIDAQEAKSALDRTAPMIRQVVGYRSDPPTPDQAETFVTALVEALQEQNHSHGHTLGAEELVEMNLPIVKLDPNSWEWECIWRLWTLYKVQIDGPIYESAFKSFIPEVRPEPSADLPPIP